MVSAAATMSGSRDASNGRRDPDGETPDFLANHIEVSTRDLLDVPIRLLAEMPRKTTLILRIATDNAGSLDLILTTSRSVATEAEEVGVPYVTPLEYEALTAALESDATTASEAFQALSRKQGVLGYRITLRGLVGAVRSRARGSRGRPGRIMTCPASGRVLLRVPGAARLLRQGVTWTVGQLIDALDAELVRAVVERTPEELAAQTRAERSPGPAGEITPGVVPAPHTRAPQVPSGAFERATGGAA